MSPIKFCKFHGFGNDYIVIEREQLEDVPSITEFTVEICHRNTGAGSDGIAVLEKLDGAEADYFCEIVNPDGSIAGFSGNGTRCAVAYLHHSKIWTAQNLRLKTRSGIKNYRLIERAEDSGYWFEAEIGAPKFASNEVPITTDSIRSSVIDELFDTSFGTWEWSGVNVGNPVACTFLNNFDLDWRALGREMETHPKFPDRANIVFVRVIDRGNIELRIWERGAGETAASGTCSSGAAVLSAFTGRTGREVCVHSPGGITEVVWREDGEMLLTGRADHIYDGFWPSPQLGRL